MAIVMAEVYVIVNTYQRIAAASTCRSFSMSAASCVVSSAWTGTTFTALPSASSERMSTSRRKAEVGSSTWCCRARRAQRGASSVVTLRGVALPAGKSFIAASNIAGSSASIDEEPPSLLARVSYSGWPLLRSRISSATSRS